METKNNSEFMSQVDAFSEEMQKFTAPMKSYCKAEKHSC